MGWPRFDVAYRIVAGINDSFDIDASSVTIAPGLYLTADDLASAIQTAILADIGAGYTCTFSASTLLFTITHTTTPFPIEWTGSYSLRDWLGWAADSGSAISHTAPGQCPGVYVASLPWPTAEQVPGWTWAVKGWRGRHNRGADRKLGRLQHWDVTALVVSEDMAQWRSVLSLLLAGLPATWQRGGDGGSWDVDYPYTSTSVVLLDPSSVSETQLSAVQDLYVQTALRFVLFSGSSPTVTDFDTASQCPELGLRFVLAVQGIPYLFLDGPTPVRQLGAAWSAPATKASQSYTLLPHTLDTSGGVRDVGPEISRRTAEVSPGSMTFRLADDAAGTVLELMSVDRTTGNLAELTAALDYDAAGTGSVVTVDDTTGWAASGLAYLGPETLYYPATAATTLGTAGNKATRDLYNDPTLTNGTTYGDLEYQHNVAVSGAAGVVTDYPAVWHGRWVSLRAFLVDPFGRAFGATFNGIYTSEVWRGVIKGAPAASDDWDRWTLQADSIDAILDTDAGTDTVRGTLLRVPGGKTANDTGGLDTSEYTSPADMPAHFVQQGQNGLTIVVAEWASGDPYGTLTGTATLDITITAGVYSRPGLIAAVNAALATAAAAAVTATDLTEAPVLQLGYWAGQNVYVLTVHTSGTSYVFEITCDFAAEGSIGPLLGFEGVVIKSPSNVSFQNMVAAYGSLAYYLGPTATGILFYPDTSENLLASPPSAGYARIGSEDEGEIVRYTSVTDKTAIWPGLYQLDVAERGALGTTPRELLVAWQDGWTTDAPLVDVVFGAGFNLTHPLTAILQVATSTGADHHGAYDTLGQRLTPALNPAHFDLSDIATAIAQCASDGVRLFASKAFTLSEWASRILRPYGRYLYARRRGGQYRIGVGRALPPLEAATATAIGESALDLYEPATAKSEITRVINRIVVRPVWDVLAEEAADDEITARDDTGERLYGERGKITWELVGSPYTALEAAPIIAGLAQQTFRRFGRPYRTLTLTTGRLGWTLSPGDTVEVTLPTIPTTTGARGLTSEPGVVLQVSPTWAGPLGSDAPTGATVLIGLEPYRRRSTYSPSARVSSYDAGTKTLTCSSSYLSSGEDLTDHFTAGDKVQVFNEGNFGTRDARIISSVTATTIVLTTTLTNCTPTSADTVVIADDYDTSTAAQQRHTYLADTSLGLGSTPDGAFHYV